MIISVQINMEHYDDLPLRHYDWRLVKTRGRWKIDFKTGEVGRMDGCEGVDSAHIEIRKINEKANVDQCNFILLKSDLSIHTKV